MSVQFFNPDEVNFRALFTPQRGQGRISIFHGIPRQRGHGIGSVIGMAMKYLLPFLSSPLGQTLQTSVLPAAADAASNIATDVIAGKNLKESVKTHGRHAVKRVTGLGKRRVKKDPIGIVRNRLIYKLPKAQ